MTEPGPTRPVVTAWFDTGAGVAGDMLLGALLDAGADLERVQAMVEAVLPGTVQLRMSQVRRAGLAARSVDVRLLKPDQPHRRWTVLRELLGGADLPEDVRAAALATFGRLARAEAAVHDIDVDDVHFHEVGAWDAVADVVGVCAALRDLGVTRVVTDAIAVGSGTVKAAHGTLPVPVPAVTRMLVGWTVHAGGPGELATPTGVALLTTLAVDQGPLPRMRVSAVGTGAGTRDIPGRANVVRVLVGHEDAEVPTTTVAAADLRVLEANVDDLDPRAWPPVLEALLAAGAADAWLVPIHMKKGRPAFTVSALATPDLVDTLIALVMAHTSTLGVRVSQVLRAALPRQRVPLTVGDGQVRITVGYDGGVIVTATPEYEDCAELARHTGQPVRRVLAGAQAAAWQHGLRPGLPWPPAGAPA